MSSILIQSRKGIVSLLAVTALVAGLTASTEASAGPHFGHGPVFWHHGPGFGYGYGYHHGFGYGGAALAGGLVLGALAASAAVADECYMTRRPMVDAYGNEYMGRVRVCD